MVYRAEVVEAYWRVMRSLMSDEALDAMVVIAKAGPLSKEEMADVKMVGQNERRNIKRGVYDGN